MNIPRFLHVVSMLLGFALAAAVAGCAGPTNERATSASDSRTASSESTVRQAAADPTVQRFSGRYTHMVDTGSFVDCRSGQLLVVATEGDNRALESAYLSVRPAPGVPVLAIVEGRVESRVFMKGPARPTLIVERFVEVRPGYGCSGPLAQASLGFSGPPIAPASALGAYGARFQELSMNTGNGTRIIRNWPEESREAAQLVIDQYGEPDEAADSQLVWHGAGPWKRIVASKAFHRHDFPAPHHDSIETFIDYSVPAEKFSELAAFDGSVIVERTAGEVSARCHDEEANFLALNLMHDIVTGAKSAQQARDYYAQEFLDYRRGKPTPYMRELRFVPPDGDTADPDIRMLSDAELERAVEEGKQHS